MTKRQPNQRSTRSASHESTKTDLSAKRDHSAAVRKAWETRRAREAARKAQEAAFTPQRPSQQAEHVSVDDQLDRALTSLAEAQKPATNWLHITLTASLVANVALAFALWG